MRILGSDFMAWYDQWEEDPHLMWDDFSWEAEDLVDRLHHPDGSWKLDPDRTYDLSELGEIRYQEQTGSRPEIDTARTVGRWLERRGKETFTVRVENTSAVNLGKLLKPFKAEVVKARSTKKSVTGFDFVDWFENGFSDDYYWEDHGETPIQGDDGKWLIDVEAVYRPSDLGCLRRHRPDGAVDDGDLDPDPHVAQYLKDRGYDLYLVLAKPDTIEAIRATVEPGENVPGIKR